MPSSPLKPDQIFRLHVQEMAPEPTGVKPKLKALPGIRAVLFDVYGTLFQSAAGEISQPSENKAKLQQHEQLIRESMEAAGFHLHDEVSPLAELFDDTIRAELDIRREQGMAYPEVDIVGVWEDFLGQLEAYEMVSGKATRSRLELVAIHYEARVNPVYPMPGVLDAISTVLDRGASLGIVSNAQKFTPLLFTTFFEDTVHALGFEELLCIWSYEHGEAKPGTLLFETVAERLQALDGIHPSETLMVGNDMLNDITPASKLGFRTALFAGDQRSLRMRKGNPAVKGVQPDVILTELDQLAECLATCRT